MISNEALYKKTSQEITALLYEALINNLEEGKGNIECADYLKANLHLQKSVDILQRLGAGLNYEAGIVADQLESLYQYISTLVLEANLKKDTVKIDHALSIIEAVTDAWSQAIENNKDTRSATMKKQSLAYEQSINFREKIKYENQ
ncbi:flagellar export chaperone FliS [Bacillus sp. H-16]|uniref:flagellar export chaperone FliS n=1 Tax=Alteribacter salitolerans TaxID=2912333 RepID=UPI001964669F|nr:flagellar export chaperone FliS [Alteribacter salitolerans]MBM7097240.1 flagellar export chaperone FliS [Alteribacter salitolerans]